MWLAFPTMTKARTILPNTSPYFPRAGNVVTAYGWGDTDKSEETLTTYELLLQ
jgi:hypothetical protein